MNASCHNICEVCGGAGSLRDAPYDAPLSGVWCDEHYSDSVATMVAKIAADVAAQVALFDEDKIAALAREFSRGAAAYYGRKTIETYGEADTSLHGVMTWNNANRTIWYLSTNPPGRKGQNRFRELRAAFMRQYVLSQYCDIPDYDERMKA